MSVNFVTILHSVGLETKESPCCGGIYAMSQQHLNMILKNGGQWYCPYCGRSIIYCQYEADKIRKELVIAENRLASERAAHDQTRASLIAHKAVNTRLKNRISNGVCPCCNRYFKNLHRHMENKHPDIKKEVEV